jgi:uncharacterized protein
VTTDCRRARPVRTCVGCGQRDAQAALVRLRLDAAGRLEVAGGAGGGRGAYVHARPECVAALAKTRLLKRSLHRDVDGAGRRTVIDRLSAAASAASAR